jgi:hypothetical protein
MSQENEDSKRLQLFSYAPRLVQLGFAARSRRLHVAAILIEPKIEIQNPKEIMAVHEYCELAEKAQGPSGLLAR